MHPAQLLSVKQEILNSDLVRIAPHSKRIMRSYEPEAINQAMLLLRAN